MIWLSIISLSVGALLAQRFSIIVLIPATFVVVLVAVAAGAAQANSALWTVMMIAAAGVSMQFGYFIGMVFHRFLGTLLAKRSIRFSHTTSARNIVP